LLEKCIIDFPHGNLLYVGACDVPAIANPHQIVDRLPSTQVEVADAEVRAVRDIECRPQRREQIKFDVVEDAGHQTAPGG